MATQGIEAVFLETHNWGKAARFFQGWASSSSSRPTTTRDSCATAMARTCSSPRSQRLRRPICRSS